MIDVLVIGGGNAALCAALMAREAGASVLLFSDACQTARLVTADATDVVLVNFDPIAARLLPLLTSFTGR